MNKITQHIEQLKIKTRKETGSFKYDFAYDECIKAVNELSPWTTRWRKANEEARKKQGQIGKNNLKKFLANLSPDELQEFHKKRLAKTHKTRYENNTNKIKKTT